MPLYPYSDGREDLSKAGNNEPILHQGNMMPAGYPSYWTYWTSTHPQNNAGATTAVMPMTLMGTAPYPSFQGPPPVYNPVFQTPSPAGGHLQGQVAHPGPAPVAPPWAAGQQNLRYQTSQAPVPTGQYLHGQIPQTSAPVVEQRQTRQPNCKATTAGVPESKQTRQTDSRGNPALTKDERALIDRAMIAHETQERIRHRKILKAQARSSTRKSKTCSTTPTGAKQGLADTHQTVTVAEVYPVPQAVVAASHNVKVSPAVEVPCGNEQSPAVEAPRVAKVPVAAETPCRALDPCAAEFSCVAKVPQTAEVPLSEHVVKSAEGDARPATTGAEFSKLLGRRGEYGQLTTCVIS